MTQAIGASTAPSTALWGLVLAGRRPARRGRPAVEDPATTQPPGARRSARPPVAGGRSVRAAGRARPRGRRQRRASRRSVQLNRVRPPGVVEMALRCRPPPTGERQRSEDIAADHGRRPAGDRPGAIVLRDEPPRRADGADHRLRALARTSDLGLREGVCAHRAASAMSCRSRAAPARTRRPPGARRAASPQIGGRGNDSSVGPPAGQGGVVALGEPPASHRGGCSGPGRGRRPGSDCAGPVVAQLADVDAARRPIAIHLGDRVEDRELEEHEGLERPFDELDERVRAPRG